LRLLPWIAAIIALWLAVAVALSSLRERSRAADRELDEALEGDHRFVDFGVVLCTVRMDKERAARMERGDEPMSGEPPVVVVGAPRRFGGMFDVLEGTWCGPSERPCTWYVSEEQEELVLHAPSLPAGIWMQGSMGAGKTTAGGIWLALRVIEHATHPLKGAGVTAPTDKRMEELRKVLFGPKDRVGQRHGGMWPKSWFTWREGDQVAVMSTGLQIDFRTTHIQSSTAGSPIQGQNWAFCLNDELQDYYELDGDIIMRGRAAWGGRYQRFVTATAKNNSGYRTHKAHVNQSEDWAVRKVIGPNSPFIWPKFWPGAIAQMSKNEAARKIWGEDAGSERAVYPSWSRDNIRPIPVLGAEDVTARVLRAWGDRFSVLVGHDPGTRCDVSILLKAYELAGAKPTDRRAPTHVWWVVGEVTTKQTTTDRHVGELLRVLRDPPFNCNLLDFRGRPSAETSQALVRLDPSTNNAGDDQHPHVTVRTSFVNAGLHALEAAYAPSIQKVKVARVPKIAGIEMIDRLLCDATGQRRLFIACDDEGTPCAPNLVRALETMELDDAGRAETERKDEKDLSHWPAALRYALWVLERTRHQAYWREEPA
jgi:hypothetical protein